MNTFAMPQVDVIFGINDAQASADYSLNLVIAEWRGQLGPWPLELPNQKPGVVIPQTSIYAWCGCLPEILGGCGTKPALKVLESKVALNDLAPGAP